MSSTLRDQLHDVRPPGADLTTADVARRVTRRRMRRARAQATLAVVVVLVASVTVWVARPDAPPVLLEAPTELLGTRTVGAAPPVLPDVALAVDGPTAAAQWERLQLEEGPPVLDWAEAVLLLVTVPQTDACMASAAIEQPEVGGTVATFTAEEGCPAAGGPVTHVVAVARTAIPDRQFALQLSGLSVEALPLPVLSADPALPPGDLRTTVVPVDIGFLPDVRLSVSPTSGTADVERSVALIGRPAGATTSDLAVERWTGTHFEPVAPSADRPHPVLEDGHAVLAGGIFADPGWYRLSVRFVLQPAELDPYSVAGRPEEPLPAWTGQVVHVAEEPPDLAAATAHPVPAPGTVQPVAEPAPGDPPVLLAADEAGHVRAFLAIAPHSGVPLVWCAESGIFVEPLGSGRFAIDGSYGFGPPPVDLVQLPAVVDSGVAGAVVRVGTEPLAPLPRLSGGERGIGTGPFLGCTATDGYFGGLTPVPPPLAGSLADARERVAADGPGWYRFSTWMPREDPPGTQAEGWDGYTDVRLCSDARCGDPLPVPLLRWAGAPPVAGQVPGAEADEPVRGVVLGRFTADGAIAELVVPMLGIPGIERVMDFTSSGGALEAGEEQWCAAGRLTAIDLPAGEQAPTTIGVTILGPADPARSCHWSGPPPPEDVLGRTLTLPLAGYPAFLFQISPEELGEAAPAVGDLVRVSATDGAFTGLWTDPG